MLKYFIFSNLSFVFMHSSFRHVDQRETSLYLFVYCFRRCLSPLRYNWLAGGYSSLNSRLFLMISHYQNDELNPVLRRDGRIEENNATKASPKLPFFYNKLTNNYFFNCETSVIYCNNSRVLLTLKALWQ